MYFISLQFILPAALRKVDEDEWTTSSVHAKLAILQFKQLEIV